LVDLSRRSEAVLGGGGVRLMVVTDATGAPLAGWYGAATTPAAMPPEVRRQVGNEALSAVAGQVQGGESLTQSLKASWTSVLAMLGLATAGTVYGSAPVLSAGHAIGAVVVGVEPASAGSLVGNAFLTTLLVGLVPLLIAILVAMALTRGLRSQVSYLLGAADRISRGDLEEPVGLDSNDELGQLARAIERMRVSLQEGMERLRNRR
jgi:HAMP domain-containing protein